MESDVKLLFQIYKVFLSVIFFLGLSISALADEYDDGLSAYEKGDYETAFRLLEPTAAAGRLSSQLMIF